MTPKEQKSRGTAGVKRRAQESKVETVRAKKKKECRKYNFRPSYQEKTSFRKSVDPVKQRLRLYSKLSIFAEKKIKIKLGKF